MTRQIHLAGATDTGKVRDANEDQYFIADLDKLINIRSGTITDAQNVKVFGNTTGHLALVADGVGGSSQGEVASQLAAESVVQYVIGMMPWFYGLNAETEDDLMEHLDSALHQCQSAVARLSANQPFNRKMATTLTMAYALGQRLYVVHVGDSRCYLFRAGKLNRLTTDHTVAHRMIQDGSLSPAAEETSKRPDRFRIGGGAGDKRHSCCWPCNRILMSRRSHFSSHLVKPCKTC